jgi:NADH dehydrogenase
VVGKGFAVLESGQLHLSGFLAWLAWAAVHLQFLGQWVWTYLTGQRGSRLIVNEAAPAGTSSAPDLAHDQVRVGT